MSASNEPEVILYDLACTKCVCFSPVVWRIRMMLNYKKVAYSTIFLEFPDIEPTLKGLGVSPPKDAPDGKHVYTVPVIRHIPSDKLIMDSKAIADFLQSVYPEPLLVMTSELGSKIEAEGRRLVGGVMRASVMPREINILSPRSQEYFRRTREASLGHCLEDLLADGREEESWKAMEAGVRSVGELMLINEADGPFVLGAKPSYTDFFIAGSLQTVRVIDEGVFQRNLTFPGYKRIYDACLPWMERRN